MLPISDLPVPPALPEHADAAAVDSVPESAASKIESSITPTDSDSAEPPPAVSASAAPANPGMSPAAPAAPGMSPAACSAQLKLLFPALFTGMAKPLKLRIQADIQTRAPGLFTKQLLSVVLRRYTGSHSYLVALTQATQRFDLDGAAAGELSAEHKQAAMDELLLRRATLREAQRTKQRETPSGTQRETPTGTQRETPTGAQRETQPRAQRDTQPDKPTDSQRDAQREAQREAQRQAQREARETQRKDAAEQALEDQKRRNRATLLHDFENTTLTPANFSALKGITVEAMEGYLAKARQEVQARRAAQADASQEGSNKPVRHSSAQQPGDRSRQEGRPDQTARRGPPR